MAEEASLDLIEISPNAVPPVAKISDYGKYKYEAQKKAHEARKHQKVIEVKEIKMRPNIDDHDYEVKMRAMKRFIEEGDKVKVTLRFRGREMVHSELGLQVLNRVRGEMDPLTKIESMPRMEGRQMIMVLAPKVGRRTPPISSFWGLQAQRHGAGAARLLGIEAAVRRRAVCPAHAVDGLAGERHRPVGLAVHPVVAAHRIVGVELLGLADLVQHVGDEPGAAVLGRRRVVEGERAALAVAAMDRADLAPRPASSA